VEDAWGWLDPLLAPLGNECVALGEAAGRVLAEPIVSQVNVPGFVRAMMDGFALRGAETHGASAYTPLSFTVIGESLPGRPMKGTVESGTAVRIMTGAPIPEGADAVLPAELCELHAGTVLALAEVPPARHVGRCGEDIARGELLFAPGRRLRPQDVGVLSSVGRSQITVVRRPVVRIVITGDELLPPGTPPTGHRIADANGPLLSALVFRDGGLVGGESIVADQPEEILAAMRSPADLVMVAGGSSVGALDWAPQLLARHGQLAVHGIAMRPSSPAGMGLLDDRLVFLLPGNPVSCLCAYDFFVGRAVRALGGRTKDWPYQQVEAPLGMKISSEVGRVDYCRVRWAGHAVQPLSTSGASLLSSTTRADGFVLVPADSEGYPAGEIVRVFLYD
jgi:molybdopterin molybdotransferase